MKKFAIAALLLAGLFPARAFDHFAENDNIREAIIRYQITKYPALTSLYFVAIFDSKTGKEVDPTDDLLKRFADSKTQIEKASEAKVSSETGHQVVDAHSGESGALFSFGGIVRKSENAAEVSCSIEQGDNRGGGFVVTLKRTNQKWEVVNFETTWVP